MSRSNGNVTITQLSEEKNSCGLKVYLNPQCKYYILSKTKTVWHQNRRFLTYTKSFYTVGGGGWFDPLLILYVCPLTKKWSVNHFNGRFIWTVRDRITTKNPEKRFSKSYKLICILMSQISIWSPINQAKTTKSGSRRSTLRSWSGLASNQTLIP